MFKKFLIAFAFALIAVPAVDTFAYSYLIYEEYDEYTYEIYDSDPEPVVTLSSNSGGSFYDVYARCLSQGHGYSSAEAALDAALLDDTLWFDDPVSGWGTSASKNPLFFGYFVNNTGQPLPRYDPPEPDPPEPGSDWLDDMWNWFLWQLGINDDYSGDIDEFITGGDRERMEIVTPTPTPLPPSPTPIVMPITDTNGNTIWNVTYPQGDGGGGNTTNNYYGDEFDVFEVDLKVGDGGSSNPRDGINSVMDSNYDYLDDVDITPVSGSFSVLPSDWYVLIGVLISFPVIAGFISKLLK